MLSDGEKILFKAKQWLDKCYLDSVPSESTVKRWYADYKCGHTDTNDAECSGSSKFGSYPRKQQNNLYKLVLADHKLKLYEIVEELNISKGSVFHHFAWTFVNEKAVFKVGAAFAHSQWFRAIWLQWRSDIGNWGTFLGQRHIIL